MNFDFDDANRVVSEAIAFVTALTMLQGATLAFDIVGINLPHYIGSMWWRLSDQSVEVIDK